jgi:peptide/nickel transport system substrate-binding protein
MKRIACPFHAGNSPRIAFMALLALAAAASAPIVHASTRPQFGGTLRVQISERIAAIDPRQWPSDSIQAAAIERVASLVFDRLVHFDDRGLLQPALATSWQHDAQWKRWEFRLRQGVKFSDGTPLAPPIAAMALQQLLGISFDVSANSNSVVILSDQSVPDLLVRLATGRYYVFRAGDDGSLAGTGPFLETARESLGGSEMVIFVANESCWAGRPFVDKIGLMLGVDPQQQANAIAFGQADVVELPASQARLTAQRGVRTVSSDLVELFALQFDMSRPAVQDVRLREAISAAIDRTSIAEVILQRQGIAAGSLLPNWVSGYTFLFPSAQNLPRTKVLLATTGRQVSRATPLVLVYDSADVEVRAVAERVAVNLKEAGIAVQLSGQTASSATKVSGGDMRLVRERITSPDIAVALPVLLTSLREPGAVLETPEQAYAAERAPIDAFRVIPLVHVSESYGLSPQVRDWMPPRWGGWRLEEVWLAPSPSIGGTAP